MIKRAGGGHGRETFFMARKKQAKHNHDNPLLKREFVSFDGLSASCTKAFGQECTLIEALVHLLLPLGNALLRLFNRGLKLAALGLPTVDAFLFILDTALFGVDFLAELAFVAELDRAVLQPHATGFTCAIFSVAVLSEVAPLEVAACKDVLIVVAHVDVVYCCCVLFSLDLVELWLLAYTLKHKGETVTCGIVVPGWGDCV